MQNSSPITSDIETILQVKNNVIQEEMEEPPRVIALWEVLHEIFGCLPNYRIMSRLISINDLRNKDRGAIKLRAIASLRLPGQNDAILSK